VFPLGMYAVAASFLRPYGVANALRGSGRSDAIGGDS